MGVKYTPQQQQVIDTRGCNLLVSAAAGSGKTAVLTERIVKMISDETKPVDIDRLLVVTFTNAAAAEMRERISAAIAKRLESEPDNGHLQKQATLIHNAQITTIDSFCMFVIRNNFNDIGLDPGFRVADEGELRLLKQDVMKELLEELFGRRDEEFLHCVEYFSTGNRDDAIEEHILKLYQFAESNPWPEEWLEERKGDYGIEDLEGLERAEFIRFGLEQARRMAEECLLRTKDCIRICEQPDGPYMYGEILEKEAEAFSRLAAVKSYEQGYALFQGMTFGRLPSKKDSSVSPEKRERVQEIRKEIKGIIKNICMKFFPAPPETALEYMKGSSGAVRMLIDLTLAFREALDRKKRDNNIIDFSDMEHLALSILVKKVQGEEAGHQEEDGKERGDGSPREDGKRKEDENPKGGAQSVTGHKLYVPSPAALDYREYFEEILIDEYQDSNLVQEMILESISGEENGKFNRFMVGDVKQSIYKFRLARPEIFVEKYEEYGKDGAGNKRIDLHKNFRSRREVLDSVNFIFSRIMGKRLGGVEYDEEAALYPGAAYPIKEEKEGEASNCTELLLIRRETEGGDGTEGGNGPGPGSVMGTEGGNGPGPGSVMGTEEPERKKLSDRQREAYAVAKRIKEMAGHFLVTDKESGALRKASYKDIVILLRTNAGWDEDFKSILKEEGIPSHVLSRTGYFAAKEIRVLLQLLRILDNPNQDIPLFGVLESFFGGFTDEEIAEIRGLAKERKRSLYFCLKEGTGEEGERRKIGKESENGEEADESEETKYSQAELEKGLKEKISRFLKFLEEYRDKTVYLPIHDLLQDIITRTGYGNYVASLPGGGQRQANVQMLLEKASAFQQTSYYGLFHFVRYMEQLEKYDVDYGEANILDENADVVRIMSIHKSKGLEFPICFVCGLAKKFNMQDMNGKMIADVDMGIGVDYVDVEHRMQGKTLRKNMIGEKMRLDNLGEELRILYVALTRAKEKLIMTGMVEKPEKRLAMLLSTAERGDGQLAYGELAGAGNYLDFLLPALSVHRAFEPLWQACGLEAPENVRKKAETAAGKSAVGEETSGKSIVVNVGEEAVREGIAGEKAAGKGLAAKEEWNGREGRIEIKILGDEDFQAAEIKEQIAAEGLRNRLEHSDALADSDSELMENMSERFAHPYRHSNLTDLYTKTTVSELKKAGQEEEQDFSFRLYEEETVIPYIPKFMREEESIGGAGRGTAFHKVMEQMDFAADARPVEEQIERLYQEGTLSEEHRQALSIPAIKKFLSTDLARRMAAAEKKGCLYREQPFVLGLPAEELNEKFPSDELVLIQGIIDVYFEEDGEIVVADYKTDRVDNGEELVKKYEKQLEYYARAINQLTGKNVKQKIIYSFRLHKEIML